MLDPLLDPFSQGIGQRALAESIVLGIVCGPLGVWVALYRQSYAAESIAHAALPGLVIASLAGGPLILGAAGGLVGAALAIALARRLGGVSADVAVAVVVTALFGLGVLLALSPEVPARLAELLFGDPLSVSRTDLAASAGLALAGLVALAAAHRPLALACFDRQSAPSLGVRPAGAELTLLVLVALTTLVAVQALGNLLVVALIVAPGAAALQIAGRLSRALALSSVLGIASGVGGLYLSYHLDLAAGASIALVAVVIFAVALLAGSRGSPAPAAVQSVG